MTPADTTLAESMVEVIETLRPDLSTHHYLRLLSLAEELDAQREEASDLRVRLSELRELAGDVRRDHDLADNEPAITLINAIEEA